MPPELVGTHPTVRWLRRKIRHLGRDRTPLILVGKAGVGKSLVAAHIHSHGPFRGRTTLLIKQIDGATVYVQERLAEALSSGHVVREGGGEPRQLACRPLFAFSLPPGELFEAGRLNRSLSTLLQSYPMIEIPPLSERTEDIPALAATLLSDCVSETLGRKLSERDWSDNIDGLRAYLWNLVVASYSEAERSREREELQKMLLRVEEGREFSLKESLARIEEAIVARALARSGGNQARAARLLGLTDRTIRRQIQKLV